MAKIYYDSDADLKYLKGKKVAIVGYGIQGRGQGLNLRDSGVDVIIAQRKGGANYEMAVKDGFKPVEPMKPQKKRTSFSSSRRTICKAKFTNKASRLI